MKKKQNQIKTKPCEKCSANCWRTKVKITGTKDVNELKKLWRDCVSFYIVSGDDLVKEKK